MSKFGRRTWDREEYAQLEHQNDGNQASSLEALSDQQLDTLKNRFSDHHALIQQAMMNSNKRTLTSGLNAYKKGKQYGFYCNICDMTFKDTLQYVNHLNHKIHQIKFEQVFDEPLILDMRDNDEISAKEFEESYSDLVNKFLKTQYIPDMKRKKKAENKNQETDCQSPPDLQPKPTDDINKIMGFGGFGTSKK